MWGDSVLIGAIPLESWSARWSFEPWVIACLAITALFYARGIFVLWKHSGTGRGVSRAQVGAFAGGWLALVAALVSPLDGLGDELFSAHMLQHEFLMLISAPLFVIARPLAVWTWSLPFAWRRSLGHFFHRPAWRRPWLFITAPLAAWVLHALALWLWHVPALFDAALANETIHSLQHVSFLFTALLFWWSVLGAATPNSKAVALISLLTTFVHTGALGALLTLSRSAWYGDYAATAPAFHLTAIEDQQLGGLIMWIPSGAVYLLCALVLLSGWLRMRPVRTPRTI